MSVIVWTVEKIYDHVHIKTSQTLVEKNFKKNVSFFSIAIMNVNENYIIRFNYFGVAILASVRKKRMPCAV